MKVKLLAVLLTLFVALPAIAAPPTGVKSAPRTAATLDNEGYIDANNIFMFVTNQGSFGRDLAGVFGHDYGTFFPYNGIQYIEDGSQVASPLYASGLWIGGVDSATGEVRVKVAEYNSEYWQGPWETAATFVDKAEYKVYKLYSDSLEGNPNSDYTNWPKTQGAPVTAGNKPAMIGDQMCWTVYHDRDDTTSHQNDAGRTKPLGIEIRQTTFAFKREGPLNNIVFIKFQVFNRGDRVIKDCYFSLWADPDLGGSSDDYVGCDTLLSVGYIYNANNRDADYGSNPPCLGYDFFQGPLVDGEDSDTAKAWGRLWPGKKTLGMSSFIWYKNGTDPNDYNESYNYIKGLQRDGSPLSNGTRFVFPGDPVSNKGDLDFDPGDRRFIESTGPITFRPGDGTRPGDSVEILAAIVVGQGVDRKSSISIMKYYDQFAQNAYSDDFRVPNPPAAPQVKVASLNGVVSLNWSDTSEVSPGDYPFEGYTVYQGESPAGPWKQIANFARTGVKIKDTVIDPISGLTEVRVVKNATDDPVQRHFAVKEDFILGGQINNLTQYYFKVEAYSYDPAGFPNMLSSVTQVAATPQGAPGDLRYPFIYGETLPVTHVTGVSDGVIQPLVLDPSALTGHTYKVTFRDTDPDPDAVSLVWNLIDTTANPDDTVLKNQTNMTAGSQDYLPVAGLLVKVSGPPVDFKNFEVISNASGVLNPPEGGAADFQGFPSLQPTTRQQTNGSRWLFHTGDNGTRAEYGPFLARVTRDGGNFREIGSYDFEMRFTATGGVAWRNPGFESGSNAPIAVPFELWNIGIATPDDPSDDYRMIPSILDVDADSTYNLSSYGADDHSASGGTNDPYTDWIYWLKPANTAPGHAGYDAAASQIVDTSYPGEDHEVLARTVLVSWNGGSAPPFAAPMPEAGTTFRITTTKPVKEVDVFTFTSPLPSQVASGEEALSQINTVPNPYYLFGPFDPAATNRQIKFQHLPKECTITIYTLGGDLVRTIRKTDQSTSIETWDISTESGLPVASGIYIYVVDAPGLGQKVGKMAVFTEAEVIKKY